MQEIQCQLENGDPTERVDEGRRVRCYPNSSGPEIGNHEYLQTSCGHMWCRYNVCPARAEMVLVTANGQVSWTKIEVVVVHQ